MHVPEVRNFSKSCRALFFSDGHLPNLFCEVHGICLDLYKIHFIEQVSIEQSKSNLQFHFSSPFLKYINIRFAL